jgi:hypothetical protein
MDDIRENAHLVTYSQGNSPYPSFQMRSVRFEEFFINIENCTRFDDIDLDFKIIYILHKFIESPSQYIAGICCVL